MAAAIICLVLAANLWFGLTAVLARQSRFELAPGAQVSDLYPRWLGTRNLILHGANPYTPAATLANERGYYGRARRPDETALDVSGFQGFSYPLSVAVVLAPVSLLPFPLVKAGATVGLIVAIFWATATWARLVGWPRTPARRWLLALGVLACLPAIDLISLQQLAGLSIVLIALVALGLRRGWWVAAGVLLALATIKPQVVALLALGLLIWAAHDVRRRWRFVAAFAATLLLLLAVSFALQPEWLGWFLAQTRLYATENTLTSPLTTLIPGLPAQVVVGGSVVVLTLAAFWTRCCAPNDATAVPLDAIALSIASTIVLLPAAATYNDTFLLFPALVIARDATRHRSMVNRLLTRSALALGVVLLALTALQPMETALGLSISPSLQVQLLGAGYAVLSVPVWLALVGQQLARRWRVSEKCQVVDDLHSKSSTT